MTSLIKLITPINIESERVKFFNSSVNNPIFHYTWEDKIPKIHFANKSKSDLWGAIQDQDTTLISRLACELFDVNFDAGTLSSAKKDASVKADQFSGSAQEYAELLQSSLHYFDITDYKVRVSNESGFNARPDHKTKTVTISQNIHFEFFSMEGGVHHEMVHILRSLNGIYNHIPRSEQYLPTEEGLASWCQDNANDDFGIKQHAIEYVASNVGIRGSFRDVFDTMCELDMSRDLAWKRTIRHKYGFIDTSQAGDIMKPAMYYAGEIKVAKMTTEEKLRLFVGKISIDDLDKYQNYIGKWSSTQISKYFKL